MAHAQVVGLVARTGFGVVADGVTGAVLVVHLGDHCVGIGALGQCVQVADAELVGILVVLLVVLADVGSQQRAAAHLHAYAQQQRGAVRGGFRSDAVAEGVGNRQRGTACALVDFV